MADPRIEAYAKPIDGTVHHLALGDGMPDLGGENISAINWNIVKELRTTESRIELDGEVVQRDGAWLV